MKRILEVVMLEASLGFAAIAVAQGPPAGKGDKSTRRGIHTATGD